MMLMKDGRCFKEIRFEKIVKNVLNLAIFAVCLIFNTGSYYDGNNIYYKLNDITIEIGEEFPMEISEYIQVIGNNTDLAIETNAPMDKDNHLTTLGKFNYYLVHNNYAFKYSKLTNVKATLAVVDTIKPTLTLLEKKEFSYGSKILASDIASCDDLSGCEMYFEEEIDTNKSGNKIVNIIAVDGGGNENTISTEITILEKPVVTYFASYIGYDNMNLHNNQLNSTLTDEEKNNLRNQIVSFAMQFVGNPYVYGGTSLTNGTDCSGFTMSVYNNFGYILPRVATHQGSVGIPISENELLPGDLVIYFYGGGGGHAALYAGNGMIVHAATSDVGIVYAPMFAGYRTYRRIIY